MILNYLTVFVAISRDSEILEKGGIEASDGIMVNTWKKQSHLHQQFMLHLSLYL